MKSLAVIGFLLIVSSDLSYGRVYDMCSLAKELHRTYDIPKNELPDWVCMAEHESGYNTKAMNRHNTDGSWDWGIFQINDEYWCYNPDRRGKSNGCDINCNQLLSSDITAAVRCAKKIQRTKGWKAWEAWKSYCQHNKPDTSVCFGDVRSNFLEGYSFGWFKNF